MVTAFARCNMINFLRKNRRALLVFLLIAPIIALLTLTRTRDSGTLSDSQSLRTIAPILLAKIDDLKQRLQEVKYENSARSQQLLILKQQLGTLLPQNSSQNGWLSLPSIYNSLPHLLNQRNAFKPAIQLAEGRKGVSVAFGIPTIPREHKSYILTTIESLVSGLTVDDRNDVIIIIFIGDLNTEHARKQANLIDNRFGKEIKEGLIEVIVPDPSFYPEMDDLPLTFNDPLERVKWRTKQNLDYCYLMMYGQNRARFYVQLEDDVLASPSYASTIRSFAMQQESHEWFMLEFSSLGFIGKLFKANDLGRLVEFFVMFYRDKPIDWLLDHILWVKACNPEKDLKHCAKEKQKLRIKFKPSLFQHIGKESSLKGKRQNLIDKDFKKDLLFHSHLNPKAVIKSTFKIYQSNLPEKVYLGHGFFWGLAPSPDDVLRICFLEPILIDQFKIVTGNSEHPGDVLHNATVEVLKPSALAGTPSDNQDSLLMKKNQADEDDIIKSEFRNSDYTIIGYFKGGVAEDKVPKSVGKVSELRIRVRKHELENWVVISEIHIIVKKK